MRVKLTTTARGYGASYQRARAALLASRPRCHWCGATATTADHEPPLHTVGNPLAWRGRLLPACGPCNFGRRVGLPRRVQRPTRSRKW